MKNNPIHSRFGSSPQYSYKTGNSSPVLPKFPINIVNSIVLSINRPDKLYHEHMKFGKECILVH